MSKAFTKEDDLGDLPALPRLISPLAPGTRNYITSGGFRTLHQELAELQETQRPPLVPVAQRDGDALAELLAVDQRIAYLQESLRTAEVVAPSTGSDDRVRFGATVKVKSEKGVQTEYRIVGVDETNLDRNWVSWQSPIARALLNAALHQRVPFKFPSGQTELEIVQISYA
jgi:transcription elongation factor GreB